MKRREILFRGFHADSKGSNSITLDGVEIHGKWAEGQLCDFYHREYDAFLPHICARFDSVDVFYDSVGQYTGLTDRNGVKIFEDDIVKVEWFDSDGDMIKSNGVIEYNENCGCFHIHMREYCSYLSISNHTDMEVIGNLWNERL